MVFNLLNDLLVLLIAYVYVFAMILLPVTLKKKDKISSFTARKMVHLFAGLVVLIVPFFTWPLISLFITIPICLMTYFSSKDSKVKALSDLYEAIGEEAEENVGMRKRSFLQGPFHYALSITFLVTTFAIIAPDKMYFPIAGILIMIIADTLASMVGKKIGKIVIALPWTNSKRTLEGSLTFFGSAFLLCLFCFSFYGILNPLTQQPLTIDQVIIYSLITSALGTIIELASPSTWDDLSVPIATTLIIFLLTLI
jgi:dolichol kinase